MEMWKVIAVSWLAACASPLGTVEQSSGIPGCPECGGNSPVIRNRGFFDLSLLHEPNAQGLAITDFVKDGDSYSFEVIDGRIRGARKESPALEGDMLVGAILTITIADDDVAPSGYGMRIAEVGHTAYWARGATRELEMYRFTWHIIGDDPAKGAPVCPDPVPHDAGPNLPELPPMFSVVFEGDRIDPRMYEVHDVDFNWFNIGCAGHALSKLALTGHTEVAKSAGLDTSREERQAMLKMLAADYCGVGVPFTIPGQPLNWVDSHAWMDYASTSHDVEARWTDAGAFCINRPRLRANPPPADTPFVVPDIRRIASLCKLDACGDDPYLFSGAHLISGNPL